MGLPLGLPLELPLGRGRAVMVLWRRERHCGVRDECAIEADMSATRMR